MRSNWLKKTILFLTGQTITLFGSALVQFAISWHMTLTTKSGVVMTIATLCGFLPQLIISPFSGVLADRFDRKKLIMLADGMIAFFTLGLFAAFSLGYRELWLLYVISAIRAIGAGLQSPAVSAFLPDLVPEDKLMKVNGFNSAIQSAMMLIAPAAAGGLYARMGLQPVFLVDVATAIIGIGILFFIKVQQKAKNTLEPVTFFEDMKLGIRYVKNTAWLWQFLLFYLIYAFMYGPVVFLTPLMVARSFGEEAWRLVAHETVFAVGMIIGGFSVSLLGGKFKNKSLMVVWACALFGATTFLMGLSKTFIFYLGVMGRVFGLMTVINSAAMPLSMVVFGPLADVISVELQLVVTGLLMIVISLGMLRAKEMLQAGLIAPKGAQSPAPYPAQTE